MAKENDGKVIEGEFAANEEKNETQMSVEAKKPGLLTRGKNFCRRHKTGLLTGAAFLLGGLAGAKFAGRRKGESCETEETTTETEVTVTETEPEETATEE